MKALLAAAFLSILRVAVMDLECFSYQGPANQLGQQQWQTVEVCASSEHHCFTTLLSYQAEDIDVPGELDCLVCNGEPNLCGGHNLPAVRCSAGEAQCVEMSISGSLKEGERTKRMIKGCGMMTSCGGLAAFSNGEHPVSYSADVKCCNGSECNSGGFSEVDPGKENGVECHSCSETGKGECSPKNMKAMKCLGTMTQCMVIQGKTSNQTLMRGCATEPFCQGLYPDFKLNARNRTTCCTGSRCNHG
ncbi:urokinase plasminogen activator surface receptor-like isoform X2 [Pleurodeles waltl]|uniref:urokinase plasminogen activator surface receptor-like isoform X2 n=1 Tax=Pleurodeles waltl TaxID=8319 RepID=UPI0037093B7F